MINQLQGKSWNANSSTRSCQERRARSIYLKSPLRAKRRRKWRTEGWYRSLSRRTLTTTRLGDPLWKHNTISAYPILQNLASWLQSSWSIPIKNKQIQTAISTRWMNRVCSTSIITSELPIFEPTLSWTNLRQSRRDHQQHYRPEAHCMSPSPYQQRTLPRATSTTLKQWNCQNLEKLSKTRPKMWK